MVSSMQIPVINISEDDAAHTADQLVDAYVQRSAPKVLDTLRP